VKLLNLKYTSLIKILILEENFKWLLEAFASQLFTHTHTHIYIYIHRQTHTHTYVCVFMLESPDHKEVIAQYNCSNNLCKQHRHSFQHIYPINRFNTYEIFLCSLQWIGSSISTKSCSFMLHHMMAIWVSSV